jgi:hypothetical protein
MLSLVEAFLWFFSRIKGEPFTSRLFAFCFVHSAQARLNSTPQLLARDRRAVAQGLFRGAKFLVSGF